jgi:hypothetical protein
MTFKISLTARVAALTIAGAAMNDGVAMAQGYPPAAAAHSTSSQLASIPLSDVANPTAALANAKVQDQTGAAIGEIILDRSGKPVELKIGVGNYLGLGTKLVSMRAGDFKFDKDHKTLLKSLTKNQIHAIAGG